jgi:hypothetical protein
LAIRLLDVPFTGEATPVKPPPSIAADPFHSRSAAPARAPAASAYGACIRGGSVYIRLSANWIGLLAGSVGGLFLQSRPISVDLIEDI